MRSKPNRLEMKPSWSAFMANIVHQVGGDFKYFVIVSPLIHFATDAEWLSPLRDGASHSEPGWRRLRDSIVLDHKQDRRRPKAGHVQALVHEALAHGPVAKEHAADRSRAPFRICGSHRCRHEAG